MEKPPMSDNDVPGPGYYQSTQPQPPKKKRRGLRIAVIGCGGLVALVVIIIIIAAVAAGTHNSTTTGTATGPAPSGPASASATTHAAGLGNPVSDGKFQFTITSVTQSKTAGDPSAGGQTAQGEYTILHVTVTNTGSVAQTLDDSAQYVYDAKGRKFSADSAADIFMSSSSNSVFFNSINPGNTVHGLIAFDLPIGDKAVRAELHDSAFSGGVTVTLRAT
jgi:hypothetical protein